jgi:biotin transport system substrate-specific component
MIDRQNKAGSTHMMYTPITAATGIPGLRSVGFALVGASLFAVLTFVGATIRIPLYPVPITLQTLFVILAGAVLGARTGTLSQSIYLTIGVVGLPLFAGTAAGLAVFSGPTGGYLLGFLPAAYLVGRLINKKTTLLWQVTVFALASVVILVLGVTHLSLVFTHDFRSALAIGFFPFLLGDAVKVLAAASIYRSYSRLHRNWSENHAR